MTESPPVAVYLHWPYCARICPYCDFNVVRERGRTDEQARLLAAMRADLAEQAARLGPRRLVSVFLGGGTPSLMDPAAAAGLIAEARRLFPPAGAVEVTLEANPTDAEADRFAAFAEAGVGRLSLGVQALDDAALAFLGRNHDAAGARRAAQVAARTFARLSIDLIYARPGQTPEAWAAELGEAIGWGAEHLSPYQLTIEPDTAFGRAFRRGALVPPDEDAAAALYETTQAVLEGAGFEAYEVSNHARGAAARSAHNLAVWRGVEYLGVGPGAHGRLQLGGARTATRAEARIGDYVARVEATGVGWAEATAYAPAEAAEERLLLALRTAEGAPLDLLADLGLDPGAEPAAGLVEGGFLAVRDGRIAATAAGRPVLDAVTRRLLVR